MRNLFLVLIIAIFLLGSISSVYAQSPSDVYNWLRYFFQFVQALPSSITGRVAQAAGWNLLGTSDNADFTHYLCGDVNVPNPNSVVAIKAVFQNINDEYSRWFQVSSDCPGIRDNSTQTSACSSDKCSNIVTGTATADYYVPFGNYMVYSDLGSNTVWARISIMSLADSLIISQGGSKDSASTGLTVKVLAVRASPEGNIIGTDLVVGNTADGIEKTYDSVADTTSTGSASDRFPGTNDWGIRTNGFANGGIIKNGDELQVVYQPIVAHTFRGGDSLVMPNNGTILFEGNPINRITYLGDLKNSNFQWKAGTYSYRESVTLFIDSTNSVTFNDTSKTIYINPKDSISIDSQKLFYAYRFTSDINSNGYIASPQYNYPVLINLFGKDFAIVGVGSNQVKAVMGSIGTAIANAYVAFGNYLIYSDLGSSGNWARISIMSSADKLIINQGESRDSAATGLTVKVLAVRAFQDGTIVGTDLQVYETGKSSLFPGQYCYMGTGSPYQTDTFYYNFTFSSAGVHNICVWPTTPDYGGVDRRWHAELYYMFPSNQPTCTHRAPSLWFSPTSQIGSPGDTLNYTLIVTNNDDSGCGASMVQLKINSMTYGLQSGIIPIAQLYPTPGASASTTLMLTSAQNAAPGIYNISVSAVANGMEGSAVGLYQIPSTVNPGCTDSDGGLNYYVKGQATLSTGANEIDMCPTVSPYTAGTTLLEAHCINKFPWVEYVEYQCPNGCVDGACSKAPGYAWYVIPQQYYDTSSENARFLSTCNQVCSDLGLNAKPLCVGWYDDPTYCRKTLSTTGGGLASAAQVCNETNFLSDVGGDHCCCGASPRSCGDGICESSELSMTITGQVTSCPQDCGHEIDPSHSDVSYCTSSDGINYSTTKSPSAPWFLWGGCSNEKQYDVSKGQNLRMHIYTDTCPSCVCDSPIFDIYEFQNGNWTLSKSVNIPSAKGMDANIFYTPDSEKIKILAKDCFYLDVFSPGVPNTVVTTTTTTVNNAVTANVSNPSNVFPTTPVPIPEQTVTNQYSMIFSPGWNLFSIPVGNEISASELFADCNVLSKIWQYSDGKYEAVSQIEPGLGYWVKVSDSCNAVVEGNSATVDQLPHLNRGWNQIGSTNQSVNFFAIIGDCSLQTGPLTYTTETGKWSKTQVLRPGDGYFVKVNGDCDLGGEIPPSPPEESGIASRAVPA